MHHQPPRAKVERSVLTYLRVHKEYSGNHSSTGHSPLHPGGQGSVVPHQRDPPPVGIQRRPPPLLIRRGACPVLFKLPPPLFPLPLRCGDTKAQGTGDLACNPPPGPPQHGPVPLGGRSLHTSPPGDLYRL